MLWLWLAILVVVVVFVLLWFIGRMARGTARPINYVEKGLVALRDRGFHWSVLTIEPKGGMEFVQFRKYLQDEGIYGIELVIPNARRTYVIFDAATKYCVHREWHHKVKKERDDVSTEYLYIDFGRDVQTAFLLVKYLFEEALGYSHDETYYVHLDSGTIKDVVIDSPEKQVQ